MTREQIEKAAGEYSGSVLGFKDNPVVMNKHKAFMDGAQWRINSVWHDGAASCEARRKALVLFDNGSAKVYEDLRELSVEQLWGHVDRFAYLDDLLPDGGKEARND